MAKCAPFPFSPFSFPSLLFPTNFFLWSSPLHFLLSVSSVVTWIVQWWLPLQFNVGSHFRSPMTIPGSAVPLWLMLYKTFFTVLTFQGKQAGSELSICRVHRSVPPSPLATISPSLTYLFVFVRSSPLNSPFPSHPFSSPPVLGFHRRVTGNRKKETKMETRAIISAD